MSEREALRKRLAAGVAELSLELGEATIERLLDYVDLLVRWNAAYNLTAVRDPGGMVTRHLLDSLAVLPFVDGPSLADLGSGATCPAFRSPWRGVSRRLRWSIRTAKGALPARGRAPARPDRGARDRGARRDRAGSFDCITARAFATLADMLALGGHLLAPGGRWLALKGRDPG